MDDKEHPLASPAGRLKWAREKLGWSQQALGDRVGLSNHAIARMENGAVISLDAAARICSALRIDLTWLAYGTPSANYDYMAFSAELTLAVIDIARRHNMPRGYRETDAQWLEGKARHFKPAEHTAEELEKAALKQISFAQSE